MEEHWKKMKRIFLYANPIQVDFGHLLGIGCESPDFSFLCKEDFVFLNFLKNSSILAHVTTIPSRMTICEAEAVGCTNLHLLVYVVVYLQSHTYDDDFKKRFFIHSLIALVVAMHYTVCVLANEWKNESASVQWNVRYLHYHTKLLI
uniref:Uncharacterized protein n=1 Tax=Glossina austeni TaxID=7395 RepID=A0A1A9VBJ7_GLOAU